MMDRFIKSALGLSLILLLASFAQAFFEIAKL